MSAARGRLIGLTAALLLVALNALVVSSAIGFVHRPRRVLETDHFHYIAMAEAPPAAATEPLAREAPFCWRILAPAVVYSLARTGVPLNAAFWATTQLFLALFLFALFASLRARGFALAPALAGITLAALMPGAVRWYEYQYWMPDPLCLWLVTLGLQLAATRRTRALFCVSVLGLLVRESYLIVPAYALLRWLRLDGPSSAARRWLMVFVLPLALFVAVRVTIVPAAGAGLFAAAREMLAFRARHLFDNQLYFASFGTFGVLFPLLAVRAARSPGVLRERYEEAAVVLVVYASLAFANNTDRLLVYALPVLVPAGLRAAAALASALARRVEAVLAMLIVLQALVYWRTPFHGTLGLSLYQPVQWSIVAVLTALGIGAARALRRAPAA
jgi:hypothetical protein